METRANYVAIGVFVLLVMGSALGALYWLYRSAEPGATALVRIIFPEPVTGLSNGGQVLFNGIRIGEVVDLRFAEGGGDNVIAMTRLNPTAPIKTDTEAVLGFQGLTGVAYISMTGGSRDAPSLFEVAEEDGEAVPTILAETSAFTTVLDSAEGVLGRMNTTLEEVNALITANRDDIDTVVENVRSFTGDLAGTGPQVSGLVEDVSAAGRTIAEVTPQITAVIERADALLSAVDAGRVTSIVDNFGAFTDELPAIGEEAGVIVGNVNGLVTRLDDAAGTLGEAVRAASGVFEAVDREAIAAIVGGVETAVTTLAERSDELSAFISNAAAASGDVAELSETLAQRREVVAAAIDDAGTLIGEAREAVAAAGPAIENLGNAVAAVTPERIAEVVTNVERFTAALGEEAEALAPLIEAATGAAQGTQAVVDIVVARRDAVDTTLADVAAIAADLRQAADSAPELVEAAGARLEEAGTLLRGLDAEALNGVVADVGTFASALAAEAPALETLVRSATGATQRIEAISSAIAQRTPQIGAVIDDVETIAGATREAAADLPALTEAIRPGLENASAVLSAIDAAAVQALVDDAATLVASLAEQREPLAAAIANVGSAAEGVEAVVATLADRAPQIGSLIERADATAAAAQEFAEALPGLAETVRPGLENASDALSAIDPTAVESLMNDAAALAETLAAQREPIGAAITNLAEAAAGVERVVAELSDRVPEIGSLIERANAAAASAQSFADRLPGVLDTVEPGVQNLSDALAAIDPATVGAIVEDAGQVTSVLAGQAGTFETLLRSATGAVRRVEAIASAIANRTPQIGTVIDNVEALSTSARGFTDILPGVAERLQPGVANLSDALSVIDPAALERLLGDAVSFAEGLAEQRGPIDSLIGRANDVAEEVSALTSTLAERAPSVSNIVSDVESAAGDLASLATQAGDIVSDVGPAVRQAAEAVGVVSPARVDDVLTKAQLIAEGLVQQGPNLDAIMEDVRETAEGARTLATAIAEDTPVIRGLIGDASAVGADARRTAEQLPELLEEVAPGLRQAGEALSALDPEKISSVQDDAARFAAAIAAEEETISVLVRSATGTAQRLEAVASALAQRTPQLGAILDDVQATAASGEAFAATLPEFAETLRPGIENASAVLSAIDPAAVETVTRSSARFAEAIAAETETIRAIIANVDGTAVRAEAIASALAERTPQLGAILDDAQAAAASGEAFAATLPEFAETLRPGIENASAVLSSVDPEAVATLVDDAARFANVVAAQSESVSLIVANVEAAASDAARIVEALSAQTPRVGPLVDGVEATIGATERFAARLPEFAQTLAPGVDNVSTVLQSLDPAAVEEIVANVQALSSSLAGTTDEIEAILAAADQAAGQVRAVTEAVAARTGEIGSAIDDVTAFAGTLGGAREDVASILSGVEGAVSDVRAAVSAVDAEAINAILTDVRSASRALGGRAEEIGVAIDNAVAAARDLAEGLGSAGGEDGLVREVLERARRIATNLETASEQVGGVVSRAGNLFDGPVQTLVADVASAATSVDDVAAAFATRADGIAAGLSKFSQSGLDDLRALLNQGRTTLAAIESAVSSFDRNPSRVIFGGANGPSYQPQRR